MFKGHQWHNEKMMEGFKWPEGARVRPWPFLVLCDFVDTTFMVFFMISCQQHRAKARGPSIMP